MKINGVGRKRSLLFVNKKKQKKFINKSFLLLFFKKEDFLPSAAGV